MSIVQECPTCTFIFPKVSGPLDWGKNSTLALQLKDHIIVNMCTDCQIDWTSTSSKTTLTKTFNLKRDTPTKLKNGRIDQKT